MPIIKEIKQKPHYLVSRDQLVATKVEQFRRERAEMRRSYGNQVSKTNLNRMRSKQSGSGVLPGSQPTSTNLPVETNEEPPKEDGDVPLRRIASSFAQVRNCASGSGSFIALPPDSEDDAREERAEVLISSQTMPLPPSESPPAMVEAPADPAGDPVAPPEEVQAVVPQPSLLKVLPEPLQIESRATERWQQLGSTVSALFRARRYIDSTETPTAQTRRLREQRELLEAFTRPFLHDAYRRE
ncbi:biotin carboxyl carrier protein of acetyl-CoA carboxylase, chloroplastic [Drosophila ficusphila]|uniref:biotin carboxyl carrier protein of acetyl-CoA carboxylase, chloroplastic n=1 Tax=Drosophila ficusphila TaxID=30025 RepID=UPI0007E662E4|nr:biotin carboxyl carrier protein of acetyl-CoA carboxylase, chloroplastic [Drosophila ficusphila]